MTTEVLELEDGMYITKQMVGPTPVRNIQMKREGLLRQWMVSIMRKWRQRKMVAMFEAMDDRILRDIGISRGEIKDMVKGFDDSELPMNALAPPEARPCSNNEPYQKAAWPPSGSLVAQESQIAELRERNDDLPS